MEIFFADSGVLSDGAEFQIDLPWIEIKQFKLLNCCDCRLLSQNIFEVTNEKI